MLTALGLGEHEGNAIASSDAQLIVGYLDGMPAATEYVYGVK